jgi:hypothetical protein
VTANPITVEMKERMRSCLTELRERSFAELKSLPEAETRELAIRGKRVQLAIYRAPQSPERALVVVQAARHRWFGITTEIYAAGFVVSSSGEKLDASDEMLWDYS